MPALGLIRTIPPLRRFEGPAARKTSPGTPGPDRVTRRVTLLLLLLLLPLAVATTAGSARAEEPVAIEVWGMGGEGRMIEPIAAAFEAANPGVSVSVQVVPWGCAHEKLVTAIVGGGAPDLCQMGTTWMPEFAAMGALEPLDPWLDKYKIERNDFFPGSVETVRYGGRWYGIPWYASTLAFIYRPDRLAEAGFTEPPTTWDEAFEIARRLKAGRPGTFPLSWAPSDSLFLVPLLRQHGATFDEHRRPCLSPRGVIGQTFEWIMAARREKLFRFGEPCDVDFFVEFERGDVAMMVGGPWHASDLMHWKPEFTPRWETAVMPGMAGPGESYIGGSDFVMFASSRRKEWAFRFLAFLTAVPAQVRLYQLTNNLPGNRRAWDSPILAGAPKLAAFRAQLDRARCHPPVPEWEAMGDVLNRAADDLLYERKSPAEAAAWLESALDGALSRERATPSPRLVLALLLGTLLLLAAGVALKFRPDFPALRAALVRGSLAAPALFLAPALLGLLVFRIAPIALAFAVSFTDLDQYGILDPARIAYVGLANYAALPADPQFVAALRNTLVFAVFAVPMNLVLALAVALGVNRFAERVQPAFRVAFFLPVVTSMVGAALVWTWIFRFNGPLNAALGLLGLSPRDWLGVRELALPALVLVGVWKSFGYNAVIFLAARRAIDDTLYEAAAIDGAGPWTAFRHVTFPALRPALLFAGAVTAIGALQFFTEPYMMTGGGPVDATRSVVYHLHQQGFRFFRMGYASAIAYALVALALLLSWVRTRLRRAAREAMG